MRILLVAHGVPSPIGQIHLHTILPELAREHEITLVCFDNNADLVDPQHLARDLGIDITTVQFRRRPLAIRAAAALARRRPLAVETHVSPAFARAVRQAAQSKAHDIVVVEQLALAPYADLVGEMPIALFPVDCISRLKEQLHTRDPSPARWADLALTRRFERYSYHRSHGTLFVSEADARYAIERGLAPKQRVHVVPNGVDPAFVPAPHLERPGIVLFFGNMGNPSNVEATLWLHQEVWPRVRARVPDARLLLAGRAPPSDVREIAARDPSVELRPDVPELVPILQEATVVVSPLRTGTGVKNRMIQSMACAKAIVATALSADGLGIIDGEHARLHDAPDRFAEAIVDLLHDPKAREALGLRAHEHARRSFSAPVAARRFADSLMAISQAEAP